MKVVHALEPLPKSIFLAGPTPRSSDVLSWRHEAIKILKSFGYNGILYVPENEGWAQHEEYDHQIEWEWTALNLATVVVFWIPREMVTLPGFTTNVEFGNLVDSGKAILGYPPNTPKIGYIHKLAERYNVPIYHTLQDTLDAAFAKLINPYKFK